MTKVCSIVPYKIFPAKLGGQKGIALFNEYLARELQLVCVTVKSNDPKFAGAYVVLNVLSDAFYRYINLLYVFTIRKIIREHLSTHLLLEHPYYGWLGILLKKTTGVKLIIHSHNIEATRWKSLGKWWWKILWWYERLVHRNADYNFFIQDDDKEYGVRQFGLQPSRCITVTYGIELKELPKLEEIEMARSEIRKRHGIHNEETILLFNGSFDYLPNLEALKNITDFIHPRLRANLLKYKIIICGKNIPEEIIARNDPYIVIAGFVEDIATYFKGADVFLNPVTKGGGIKTKLVEALAYNLNAVSTRNGAIGIDTNLCDGKLLVSPDDNWDIFSELVVRASALKHDLPQRFFDHFYWGNSVRKAAEFINNKS